MVVETTSSGRRPDALNRCAIIAFRVETEVDSVYTPQIRAEYGSRLHNLRIGNATLLPLELIPQSKRNPELFSLEPSGNFCISLEIRNYFLSWRIHRRSYTVPPHQNPLNPVNSVLLMLFTLRIIVCFFYDFVIYHRLFQWKSNLLSGCCCNIPIINNDECIAHLF